MNTNDIQALQQAMDAAVRSAQLPFHVDFWVGGLLAIAGIVVSAFGVHYSWKAFKEAGAAKQAAKDAGKTVKYLTVAIELTELLQKLDSPAYDIRFDVARDRLSETTRRLHRALSPFEDDLQVKSKIASLWTMLAAAKEALGGVHPTGQTGEAEAPRAVYYAVEEHFAAINDLVGDLVGIFEQKTTNVGDENVNKCAK